MIAQREAGSILNFHHGLASAVLALAVFFGGNARADWVASAKSQARLIDGGAIEGERYAGVELRLAGSAVTYWRDAGEAGAPPVFDFAGSTNVSDAKVLYPQPEKIDEGGILAFGYQHGVLFPIRVTPLDRTKPAVLALNLDYAVCEAICLPNRAKLEIVLPPQAEQLDAAPLVVEAMKHVPRSLDSAQAKTLAALTPAAAAGGRAQWHLKILSPGASDVFIEAPKGFYVETRPNGAGGAYLLTLAEHPPAKDLPDTPLRVTVSGPAPAEFDLTLPPARP
jgi:DsbC/DsbD-like thiol-disulfide interchange protein